jgi:hypothetical protein
MIRFFFILFVAIAFFITACSTIKENNRNFITSYSPESKELHDSISQMDSILFEAYNNCKPEVFESLLSNDIEFYHDRGGLITSKQELVVAIKNNICGKVTRELLKGSIEVYPIPNYGAVQMGLHRFYNKEEATNTPSRFSKFVHTWLRENGKWKLSRVISLH